MQSCPRYLHIPQPPQLKPWSVPGLSRDCPRSQVPAAGPAPLPPSCQLRNIPMDPGGRGCLATSVPGWALGRGAASVGLAICDANTWGQSECHLCSSSTMVATGLMSLEELARDSVCPCPPQNVGAPRLSPVPLGDVSLSPPLAASWLCWETSFLLFKIWAQNIFSSFVFFFFVLFLKKTLFLAVFPLLRRWQEVSPSWGWGQGRVGPISDWR